MKNLVAAFGLLVSSPLVPALSTPQASPQAHVSGIYSDLYYNSDGGDLLGMELVIIPNDSGYVACVQIAEGGSPFVIVVPISIIGAKVEFTIPQGSQYGGEHFAGYLSGRKLVLHWAKGQEETLLRGKSYWQ